MKKKTKQPAWVSVISADGTETESLVAFDSDTALFLASVSRTPNANGIIEFAAFSRDRVLKTCYEEVAAQTVEEAKEAVIAFLIEEGVIKSSAQVETGEENEE
jgi:predicted deacylase